VATPALLDLDVLDRNIAHIALSRTPVSRFGLTWTAQEPDAHSQMWQERLESVARR
jgi:hypothetical protein